MITKAVPARAHTRSFAIGVDYITEHTHQRAAAKAGHSFEGGVSYASAPEKAEWVHLRGVMSVETAAIEMEAVAALSKRCRDPVYHLIIAYAKGERPTHEQVVSDAERLLKAIGMEKSQYVLAAHKDTDDFHAHVIANRIGPDGKANDLWHERIIRERVCAEIAAERGWEIVVGHHNRDIVQRARHLYAPPPDPERRLSDGAYRRLHERGELPWQESARPYVLDAVDRAKDWSDLHQRLGAHGVVVKLVRRGERVQGLAFSEGLDRRAPGCAASRIDSRCALRALESRLGPFIPSPEPAMEVAHRTAWAEMVRPKILTAVDSAKTWDELMQRLDRDGIVVKLIQRGARVQGLAFAAGAIPRHRAVVRRGSIRVARRQRWSNASARSRMKRSSELNPSAARSAIGPSTRLIVTRAGQCVTPNASPTMLGCARSTQRIATVSSVNVPTRSVRGGMQRGSASGCSGSAMPKSAAKRACYCAQWRGWARAVRSPVSWPTGRLMRSSAAGARRNMMPRGCAGRRRRSCWRRSGSVCVRRSRWIIAPLLLKGRGAATSGHSA